MALINGTESAAKNVVFSVTLDKTALFDLASVVADSYFSDPQNVKLAKVIYKSSEGEQLKNIIFDLSQATPETFILFSQKARAQFNVLKIILVDFDGGSFAVSKSDIPPGLTMQLESLITFTQAIAGKSLISSTVRAVATDSNGNVYIGGGFTNYNNTTFRNYLIKVNSSGVLDTTFMTNAVDGAKFNGQIYSIAIDSNDNVYIGGQFTNYGGINRSCLIKVDSSGVLDSTFMTNAVDGGKFPGAVNRLVATIAIDSNDNVYIGGDFITYGGTAGRNSLIKVNSSGVLDTTFMTNAVDGSKFNFGVNKVLILSDNDVYVGGAFTSYGGTSGRGYLIKVNSSGTLDSTFMTNVVDGAKFVGGAVFAISVDSNSNIYIGGNFTSYAGTSGRNRLIKVNSSGVLDTTFMTNAVDGSKISAVINSITIDSNNDIYIGGDFINYASTTNRNRLIKVNSSGVLDTTFMTNAVDGAKLNNTVFTVVKDLNDNIYIGGLFFNYLTKVSTSGVLSEPFVTNVIGISFVNNQISAIATDSSNNVYIGGNFTNYGNTSGRNRLIKVNSSGVLDATFMANAVDGSKFNNQIYSIAIDSNNNVYIGGDFITYGGTNFRNYLIKVNSSGVLDSTFMTNAVDGNKFSSTIRAIAIDSNDNIYIGGAFTNYNNTSGRNRLIKVNSSGVLDTTFMTNAVDGTKFSSTVFAIAKDLNNNVYIGGAFTSYAGTSGRNRLIKVNSSGVLDTTFMTNAVDGTKFSNIVYAIIADSNNNVYIGGDFITYGGTVGRSRLIKADSSGNLDTTFMTNAVDGSKIVNGAVNSIVLDSDNVIYVGGGFTGYPGATNRNCLIKVNSSGVLDSTFMTAIVDGGKIIGIVNAVLVKNDGKVCIGGTFSMYNTIYQRFIAVKDNAIA
jgi:uncharacterized delta-60 repeat protein